MQAHMCNKNLSISSISILNLYLQGFSTQFPVPSPQCLATPGPTDGPLPCEPVVLLDSQAWGRDTRREDPGLPWSDTAPTMTLCYSSLNKARLWPFILELYLYHDRYTQIRPNNVTMLVGSTRNVSIPSLLHQRGKCGD